MSNFEYKNQDTVVNNNSPCITADTLILTNEGLQPVNSLINKSFVAIVNDKEYHSTNKGFWHVGRYQTFKIKLECGIEIKATINHSFLASVEEKSSKDEAKSGWIKVSDLKVGNLLSVSVNKHKWQGRGTYNDGYSYAIVPSEKSAGTSYEHCCGCVTGLLSKQTFVNKDKSELIYAVSPESHLLNAQQSLLSLGVFSKVTPNELIITGDNLKRLFALMRQETLADENTKFSTILSPIASITEDDIQDVYDCTIEGIHSFSANGIIVGDYS